MAGQLAVRSLPTASIVVDCDNTLGLPFKDSDDGLALALLLGDRSAQVVAVTTTFGNGSIDQVCRQTKRLLRRFRRRCPIYRGAARAGCGVTEAAAFLAKTVADQPGEITIVATGPLTNLNAASQIDPRFFHNVRRIVCMAGYRERLTVGWRQLRELNLAADPRAAQTVLDAPCAVDLVDADVCRQLPFTGSELAAIRAVNGLDRVLSLSVACWGLAFRAWCGTSYFVAWDLVAAACAVRPDLFISRSVTVDTRGPAFRMGQLSVKRSRGHESSVRLLIGIVDPEAVRNLLLVALRRLSAIPAHRRG